jgi:hypothetical protein
MPVRFGMTAVTALALAVTPLIGGAQAPSQPPRVSPDNAFGPGLYIAAAQSNIFRHTLVGGVPASQPNYAYGSIYPTFLAVAPNGDVFAGTVTGSSFNGITRFKLDSNLPKSSLAISLPGYQLATSALGIDPQDYLYVSYVNRGSSGYAHGVLVYPPKAHGSQAPIQNIGLPSKTGDVIYGLAFDSMGELFVSNFLASQILVYSHPTTQPVLARIITSSAIVDPEGIAIDKQDELYVLSHGQGTIAAFHDTVGSKAKPDRTMSLTGGFPYGGIAVDAKSLFVPTIQGAVCQLNKAGVGQQSNLSVLNYSFSSDVKLGR